MRAFGVDAAEEMHMAETDKDEPTTQETAEMVEVGEMVASEKRKDDRPAQETQRPTDKAKDRED